MEKYEVKFEATIWRVRTIEADNEADAKVKFLKDFPSEAYAEFESELLVMKVTEVKGE